MEIESLEQKNDSDEEILRIAKERFHLAEEAYNDVRQIALEDLEFSVGEQWPEEIRAERERDQRPCFTINRMPQQIRQVTNDQRQNRPAIKVSPVDDKADIETAKILQGIIRHIENDSNADVAYDTGFDGAVRKSFGFWRVITEYVSPRSFEQQIKIKAIRNAFSCYLDPSHKEPDGSDANWGFIFEDVPYEQFRAEYKKAKVSQRNEWQTFADQSPGWVTESTVRVAEYFYKDYQEIEIVLLSDGTVVEKSDLEKQFPDGLPEGIEIKDERTSTEPVIKWCKINGVDVLEKTDWLGRWIPLIPTYGDIIDVNGRVIYESLIRHAKDAQFLYNLWRTTEAETIGLAPKAPWVIAEGQVTEENQHIWATANSKAHAYLPYSPKSINGEMIGPPQRNAYEPPTQAITTAGMQASEDIKSTTGIFDAALGQQSNETSGIAIQRRAHQSQTSNFHFVDNLTRSIRHTGRILVDLIPKVYDTARVARIIGEEGQEEVVKINQYFQEQGHLKMYDLSAGTYDVTVDTGPSFATKRQEAVASMIDLSQTSPQLMQVAGDLIVKNMDWPGATEISERIKKTLPPGLAEDDKNGPPIPPQAQAVIQQLTQQNQQLVQELKAATDPLMQKKMELESKERIEFAKMDVDLRKELLKAGAPMSQAIMAAEIQNIGRREELVGMEIPIENPMNQNFNGAGPDQAAIPNEQQQSTGGFPPGPPMGV